MIHHRIAVIGATGGTGSLIVKSSLAAGYEVIAAARQPEKIGAGNSRLEIRQADLFEPGALDAAVKGAEAVVSAIGTPRAGAPVSFYSEGIGNILAAMRRENIRRLICISASGYIDAPAQPFGIRFLQGIVQKVFRYNYEDMQRMEKIVSASETDWTIVRPPRLTNGQATNFYRVQKGVVIGSAKVSRADLADYIVRSLFDPHTFRSACGVAF